MKKEYKVTIQVTEQGLRINDNLCEIYRGKIVTINNGSTGGKHSAHPNIDASGSVSGMKKLGYWDKSDVIVRQKGYFYNTSKVFIGDDPIDALAYFLQNKGDINIDFNKYQPQEFTFTV